MARTAVLSTVAAGSLLAAITAAKLLVTAAEWLFDRAGATGLIVVVGVFALGAWWLTRERANR